MEDIREYIFRDVVLIDLEQFDHNPQKSRFSRTVCEKTDYTCFPFHRTDQSDGTVTKLVESA